MIASPESPKADEGGSMKMMILLVNGLLPMAVITYFCVSHDWLIIGMLVMHVVVMITLPLLFLKGDLTPYTSSLKADFSQARSHIGQGMLLMASIITFGLALYIPSTCKSGLLSPCFDFTPFTSILGSDMSRPALIAAGLYFTFVNPLVEELFWRVFLHKELCLTYLTKDQRLPTPDTYGTIPLIETPKSQNASTFSKLVLSTMYALYHGILLTFRISPTFGILGFLFLLGFGLALVYTREHVGIFASVCLHAAIDGAVVVSLYYEKFG